jgi:hypothetical protein
VSFQLAWQQADNRVLELVQTLARDSSHFVVALSDDFDALGNGTGYGQNVAAIIGPRLSDVDGAPRLIWGNHYEIDVMVERAGIMPELFSLACCLRGNDNGMVFRRMFRGHRPIIYLAKYLSITWATWAGDMASDRSWILTRDGAVAALDHLMAQGLMPDEIEDDWEVKRDRCVIGFLNFVERCPPPPNGVSVDEWSLLLERWASDWEHERPNVRQSQIRSMAALGSQVRLDRLTGALDPAYPLALVACGKVRANGRFYGGRVAVSAFSEQIAARRDTPLGLHPLRSSIVADDPEFAVLARVYTGFVAFSTVRDNEILPSAAMELRAEPFVRHLGGQRISEVSKNGTAKDINLLAMANSRAAKVHMAEQYAVQLARALEQLDICLQTDEGDEEELPVMDEEQEAPIPYRTREYIDLTTNIQRQRALLDNATLLRNLRDGGASIRANLETLEHRLVEEDARPLQHAHEMPQYIAAKMNTPGETVAIAVDVRIRNSPRLVVAVGHDAVARVRSLGLDDALRRSAFASREDAFTACLRASIRTGEAWCRSLMGESGDLVTYVTFTQTVVRTKNRGYPKASIGVNTWIGDALLTYAFPEGTIVGSPPWLSVMMPDGDRYRFKVAVHQATSARRRYIRLSAFDFDMRPGESLHAEFYVTQMGELGMRMLSWVNDETGLDINRHLRSRMFGPRTERPVDPVAYPVDYVPHGGWELEVAQAIYGAMNRAIGSEMDFWLEGVQRRNFRKLLLAVQQLTFKETMMYGEFSPDMAWPLVDWAVQERWRGYLVQFMVQIQVTLPDQTVEDVDLSLHLSKQMTTTMPARRFRVHFPLKLGDAATLNGVASHFKYLQLGLRPTYDDAPHLIVARIVASPDREEVPRDWVPLSRDHAERHRMVDAAVRDAIARADSQAGRDRRAEIKRAERELGRESARDREGPGGDSSRQRTS